MGLVDDGLMPRGAGPVVLSPIECGVDNDRLGHRARRIGIVHRRVVRVGELVADLYKQGDKFVFMDTETYEQLELTEEEVGRRLPMAQGRDEYRGSFL